MPARPGRGTRHSPPVRRGPSPPARRGGHGPRRRSTGQRVLIGVNVFVALCLIGAGATFAYVKLRFGQIGHVHVAGITLQAVGQPMNVLVVGSDSRAVLNPADAAHFGTTADAAGQRSDVIIVLHVDPASKQASILSFPRDLIVHLAGTNKTDRINSAFNNGPSQLVQTIQNDFNIPINHFVEVNFDGFQGLVDAVGGIRMDFPYPVRDNDNGNNNSGLNIANAGCQQINGAQALSLVRSRFFQYYKDGSWHSDPLSDLGRIRRQHAFLHVLAAKAFSAGLSNPLTANALVSKAVKDVQTDPGLSISDVLTLARRFQSSDPNAVATYTFPTIEKPPNLAVLYPDPALSQPVIDAFLGRSAPSTPGGSNSGTSGSAPSGSAPSGSGATSRSVVQPSSVSIQVLNGTGTTGEAARVASQLHSQGFSIAGTGNAPTVGAVATTVAFAPGQRAEAELVASALAGVPVNVTAGSSSQAAPVVLSVGSGLSGVHAPSTTAGSGAPAASGSPGRTGPTGPVAQTATVSSLGHQALQPFDPRACP